MGTADTQKRVADGFAWFLNVSTSVLIVFVNKVLMDPKKGYGFTFGELQQHSGSAAPAWWGLLNSLCCLVRLQPPRSVHSTS